MIRKLVITNLVLVETCEILFGPSFNTVTGETGAGKTVLTEAIRLCLGERADTELIRTGCDRSTVELYLSLERLPLIKHRLEEAGLDCEEEEIIIRRELAKEGKNRAFINCRAVPLPLLQEIGSELIDLIGQQSQLVLRSSDQQKQQLDLFGDLEADLIRFQASYQEERGLEKRVNELEALCLSKDKNEAVWRFQWEELDKARLQENEEETLFARYEKLTHAQETTEKITQMAGSCGAIIPQLNKLQRLNDSLLTIDPSLQDVSTLLQEALIPLKEAQRALESKMDPEELPSPQLLSHLEERLSLISKLKRKYGATFQEMQTLKNQLEEQLATSSTLSDDLEEAKRQLTALQSHTHHLGKILTEKRTEAARRFGTELTAQLQDLNMKGARVEVCLLPCARTSTGDDLVQFWLQANAGEALSLVKERASGGEVSRLLFATKIVLAEKNKTPTLIFDEIDANVGGKTATLLGKKLQELGQHKQVICITHFPQVASQANTHIQVQKREMHGRTVTQICLLDPEQTKEELVRMGGG